MTARTRRPAPAAATAPRCAAPTGATSTGGAAMTGARRRLGSRRRRRRRAAPRARSVLACDARPLDGGVELTACRRQHLLAADEIALEGRDARGLLAALPLGRRTLLLDGGEPRYRARYAPRPPARATRSARRLRARTCASSAAVCSRSARITATGSVPGSSTAASTRARSSWRRPSSLRAVVSSRSSSSSRSALAAACMRASRSVAATFAELDAYALGFGLAAAQRIARFDRRVAVPIAIFGELAERLIAGRQQRVPLGERGAQLGERRLGRAACVLETALRRGAGLGDARLGGRLQIGHARLGRLRLGRDPALERGCAPPSPSPPVLRARPLDREARESPSPAPRSDRRRPRARAPAPRRAAPPRRAPPRAPRPASRRAPRPRSPAPRSRRGPRAPRPSCSRVSMRSASRRCCASKRSCSTLCCASSCTSAICVRWTSLGVLEIAAAGRAQLFERVPMLGRELVERDARARRAPRGTRAAAG